MTHELRARLALEKYGFRFTHSLGQNFLLDDQVIARIAGAAGVGPGDNILEIGAGAGVLTARMRDLGANVLALEVDRALEKVLAEVVPGARVVFEDALKADIEALTTEAFGGAPYRVVANLPYYITSDMLSRLTRLGARPTDIVVMVQKEAAQRLMARPGQKAYCLMAAMVAYYGEAEELFTVGPEAFTPPPHVTSVLLRVRRHETPPVLPASEDMLRRVMAACFAMRRKTLANNLCAAFGIAREDALRAIVECALSETVRGEALTLAQMGAVADSLCALTAQGQA